MVNTVRYLDFERDVLAAAQKTLSDCGFDVEIARDGTHDALMKISHGRRRYAYRIELKRTVSHATVGTLLLRKHEAPSNRLLVTEYVTPPIAERLRELHLQFVDAAGNAFLDQQGMFVLVTGRKRRQPVFASRSIRAFQESGLRLVFALLTRPDLSNEPFRTIAAETGVAIGTVQWVMKDLRDHGFLADFAGGRRLLDASRLMAEWTEGYTRVLRPKLLLARFEGRTADWWKNAKIAQYNAVWGGEVAAARLARFLKPAVATIYVDQLRSKLILDHRLRPASDGHVEIRERFWRFDDEWRKRGVTPPLLIYADLLAVGDARSSEAARLIQSRYLSGPLDES